MNAAPMEQEETRPARRKPVVVKPRPVNTGVRLVGCPAYPTIGLMAGASIEWCRKARGKMDKCATCQWKKA